MALSEMLDWCDAGGNRLGAATRAEVHARGLWHHVLHLWLADTCDGGSLIYQLRAPDTATWPDLFDVSAAGHLLAGESHADAMREAREEIGLSVPPESALPIGVRMEEGPDPGGGMNREFQSVFIALRDAAWGDFAGIDHEAAGIAWVRNADGLRLHGGEVDTIDVAGLRFDQEGVSPCRWRLDRARFVPRADGYYCRIHEIAGQLLRGEPFTPSL